MDPVTPLQCLVSLGGQASEAHPISSSSCRASWRMETPNTKVFIHYSIAMADEAILQATPGDQIGLTNSLIEPNFCHK